VGGDRFNVVIENPIGLDCCKLHSLDGADVLAGRNQDIRWPGNGDRLQGSQLSSRPANDAAGCINALGHPGSNRLVWRISLLFCAASLASLAGAEQTH